MRGHRFMGNFVTWVPLTEPTAGLERTTLGELLHEIRRRRDPSRGALNCRYPERIGRVQGRENVQPLQS